MTDKEAKLIDVLMPFGIPTNIMITDDILTFDLKEPVFESNMAGLLEFQKVLIKEFEEYRFIHKLENDDNHYWTVLMKLPCDN